MKKQAKKLLKLRRKVQYLKRELGILTEANDRLAKALQTRVLFPDAAAVETSMSAKELEEWKAALAEVTPLLKLKEFAEGESGA